MLYNSTFSLYSFIVSSVHEYSGLAEEQYVMLVCMLIWGGLVVGEMIWNLLLTHLYSFFEVDCLGKDTRLVYLCVYLFSFLSRKTLLEVHLWCRTFL